MPSNLAKSPRKRKPRRRPGSDVQDVQKDSLTTRKPKVTAANDYSLAECFEEDQPSKKKRRSIISAASTINQTEKKSFLNGLLKDDQSNRGTHIPKWVLRIIPDATEALVFAQLVYWLSGKTFHSPNQDRGLKHRWIAKSAVDLAGEIHLKRDAIDKAFTRLKRRGFICWVNRKFGGKKQRHVSIDWANIHSAYKQVASEL